MWYSYYQIFGSYLHLHGDLQRTSVSNKCNRQHEIREPEYRSEVATIAKKSNCTTSAQQKWEEIISAELQMSVEQIERDEYYNIVLYTV